MAKHLEAWGRETARSRYGSPQNGGKSAGQEDQKPQFPEDQHAKDYDNGTPANWLRGMGKGEAEGKPSFDKSKGKR